MKNKFTILTYIKKNILNTRNIILTLVISFISVILFFSISFLNYTIENENYIKTNYMKELNINVVKSSPEFSSNDDYMEYTYSDKHNIDFKDSYDELSNYEHVVSNLPVKYNDEILLRYKKQDDEENEKAIVIKALFKNDSIKLLSGKYPEKNEIVCPAKLYPYSLVKTVFDMDKIDTTKVIDTSKEIGKMYNLVEYRFKTGIIANEKESRYNNDIDLKVVGTYDNKYSFDGMSTCYTSFETYDNFRDCEGYITYEKNGSKERYCEYYNGRVLTVDSKENVSSVISKLEENGFDTFVQGKMEMLPTAYIYPIIIGLVTICLSITVLLLFINKKNINKRNNFAILQAQGFKIKTIVSMEILDNITIYTIGFILSFILYYILFSCFTKTILSGYSFYGLGLQIPYLVILIIYVLINIVICMFTIYKLKKILKKDILLNLGNN